ncbi:MAG: alpha/beta fold hydrolase [Planctomycetota bacterium]
MDAREIETVEIEPRTAANAAVIWLHGLGADGHDFEPVVPMLGLGRDAAVRFVFPHAPVRPVTINMGMPMRAWYDIRGMDFHEREDEAGILDSTAIVEDLIERENERGVPTARIVLAGFSQGGAIALHAGLRHRERLAGIVALSTYLVRGASLAEEAAPANRDVPILQAHGTFDPMVVYERGRSAREALAKGGWSVEWHEYPMQHQVCQEELEVIGAFLRAVVG